MQVSFNQQNTSHLLHSTTHLLYRPDQGADPQEAFAKDGVVVWNCSPQRCPVDVTGTALGDLLPVCPNGACRVFVIVPVSVRWQPADLSTLATKRRCCCVSQPEADKQTDSRPAAVAMRVCVCGGGARVSQAAVSTRGSIMNIHDTPIPSNLQLDTYTDTHTHTLNDGNNGYKSSPEPPPSRSYFEFTFKAPLLQSERARQGVTSTCWNPHINVLLGSVFCYLKSLNFVGFFPGFVCQATHRLVLYSLISQDNPSTHTAPSSC